MAEEYTTVVAGRTVQVTRFGSRAKVFVDGKEFDLTDKGGNAWTVAPAGDTSAAVEVFGYSNALAQAVSLSKRASERERHARWNDTLRAWNPNA